MGVSVISGAVVGAAVASLARTRRNAGVIRWRYRVSAARRFPSR